MVVCISTGVPGARWMTTKDTRVIPRSMGKISITLLKRYNPIGRL
jgi:hypothetical protein